MGTRALKVQQLRSSLHLTFADPFAVPSKHKPFLLPALTPLFPAGVPRGSFLELTGTGAFSFAAAFVRELSPERWAVVDSCGTFFPPGAAAARLDLQRLILIRTSPHNAGWACGQLLRSKEIGAVLWASPSMDNMLFRRLQLASERGGGIGLLLRPVEALRKPCWGSARLKVERLNGKRLSITLLYARGRHVADGLSVEVDA